MSGKSQLAKSLKHRQILWSSSFGMIQTRVILGDRMPSSNEKQTRQVHIIPAFVSRRKQDESELQDLRISSLFDDCRDIWVVAMTARWVKHSTRKTGKSWLMMFEVEDINAFYTRILSSAKRCRITVKCNFQFSS